MTSIQSDPFGHYRQWLFTSYLNRHSPVRRPRRRTSPLSHVMDIVSTEPAAPVNGPLHHLLVLSRPQPQLFTREALTSLYEALGGDASSSCMDFILTHFYYKLESPGLHPGLAPRFVANDMARDYVYDLSFTSGCSLSDGLLAMGEQVIASRMPKGQRNAYSRMHLWRWGLGAQAPTLLYLLDRNRDCPRNRSLDSLTYGVGHLPNSSRVTLRTILQGLERDKYVTRTGRRDRHFIYLLNSENIIFSYVN